MKKIKSRTLKAFGYGIFTAILGACTGAGPAVSPQAAQLLSTAMNGPTPQTAQILAQAQKTVAKFAPLYTTLPVHVLLVPHPYESPLLAIPSKPRCNLVVNSTPSALKGWGFVLPPNNPKAWDAAIEVAVLHELGHCVFYEYFRKYPVRVSEQEKEVFADMFMLNVLSTLETDPLRDAARAALLHSRAVFGPIDTVHNTLPKVASLQKELTLKSLKEKQVLAKTFETFEKETGIDLGFSKSDSKQASLSTFPAN